MNNNTPVYILFGSQTGQAEAIANEIYEAAVFQNLNVELHGLKHEGKAFNIQEVKCAIFICSTTGDGDPPENARKFIRSIKRKTLPNTFLKDLFYALLGLGDTNYSTFCGGPKTLEKALKARGASTFYPTAFADDGVDLEGTVEPWIDGLFPALKSHIDSKSTESFCPENTLELPEDCNVKSMSESEQVSDDLKIANSSSCSAEETNNKASRCLELSFKKLILKSLVLDEKAVLSSPLRQISALSNQTLSLPILIEPYLSLTFDNHAKFDAQSVTYQNGAAFPIASSDVIKTKLVSAVQLSRDDALKRALEVKLLLDTPFQFSPGDSFGVCCENDAKEVNWLIERLSLTEKADVPARLNVKSGTVKKNAIVPSFIPQPFTIRHALRSCLDIRVVPKKPLLRALVENTSIKSERRSLEELCSKQGASAYMDLIRAANVTLLDVLATFPSCNPSFELLAQHLPRLQPRRYSIANSPLVDSCLLTFVFNVVRFNAENGLVFQRNGICTGFLESYVPFLSSDFAADHANRSIEVFFTKSTGFRLPDNNTQPLVMIGPGTGVAPFVGFLEHRAALKEALGEAWLFYGCRHQDRDFLYRDKLKKFEFDGVLTRLIIAFSRDSDSAGTCRYVQDNLRLHKNNMVDLLLNKNAVFYVCGDARNMAKDVRRCLIEIIASETNCDETAALEKFQNVISDNRYKEDIWS